MEDVRNIFHDNRRAITMEARRERRGRDERDRMREREGQKKREREIETDKKTEIICMKQLNRLANIRPIHIYRYLKLY